MTSRDKISFPVKAEPKVNGFVLPKIATEECLEILDLKATPTVWGLESGRPIYDRLPSTAQQYKKGYDRDQTYVFLDAKTGRTFGPGSMQAGSFRERPSVIFVESGIITSYLGQTPVDAFEVDISELNFGLGLENGPYQIGYQISEGIPSSESTVPGYELIRVESSNLGDAAIAIEASQAVQYHEDYFAISEEGSWWPNTTNEAGAYYPASWYVIDFQASVKPERFVLEADSTQALPTAKLALYWSDDAIIWNKYAQVDPTEKGWEVDYFSSKGHRYWRFFFWDGLATIKQILYTGTAYFPDSRVTGEVTIATPYIDNLYEEVEGNYLLLASFEVKDKKVENIVDARRVSTVKYEPVSDWLSNFQDNSLRCLLDDVEFYSEKYLAPPTADYHLYEELDDSVCSGLGEFDLEGENLSVLFPDIVELDESTPEITPDQVILVQDPESPSDLATRVYANDYIRNSWSLDNGRY